MRVARLPDTPPHTYDRRVCYWIQKSINHQATESGNDALHVISVKIAKSDEPSTFKLNVKMLMTQLECAYSCEFG